MKNEPPLRAPASLLIFAGLLLGIHLLRQFSNESTNEWLLINFAFIPALFSIKIMQTYSFIDIRPWSVFTYVLLHGNWTHVVMNTLWLLAFGSPLAKRFGAVRFYTFCALSAPAGALAYYLVYWQSGLPMIGASAVVSALTAGAVCFAFDEKGPLRNRNDPSAEFHPAKPLRQSLQNPQALFFVLTWFGVNFVFGTGASLLGPGTQIAWQAHIGGFLAGLFLFFLLDPIKKRAS
jgi:membrane associated rhomboid family serine protease